MGDFPSKAFDRWVTQNPEDADWDDRYCDDCGQLHEDCECDEDS